MVDQEVLDITATITIVGDNGVICDVEFELSPSGAQISHVLDEGGAVNGYFYITYLDSGFMFLLPEFVIGVLVDFDITPS